MELQVFDNKGKEVKKISVSDEIFDTPDNDHVLYLAVKAYQANRRQGTHATKTRSLVSGGGKKPYKQKGTGNARQGTGRTPLKPGGATLFGPQPRSYRQKSPKSLKRLALRVALSNRARHKKLFIVNDFAVSDYKTKEIVSMFNSFNVKAGLLADERKEDKLYKSTRNIHGASAICASELNAEHVLRHENIFVSESALNSLTQRLSNGGEA